jgi:hypothetical protein
MSWYRLQKTLMKKLLFIFSLPLLLTACGIGKYNVAYSEPKDGDRARIRVIVPTVFNAYRGVTAFPNMQCLPKRPVGGGHVVGSYAMGFENNLNGQKIGIPASAFSDKKGYVKAEAYLSANQPVMFTFSKPNSTSESPTALGNTKMITIYPDNCFARVVFIPQTNADYELVFTSETSCQFELNRLTVDQGVVSTAPVIQRNIEICH